MGKSQRAALVLLSVACSACVTGSAIPAEYVSALPSESVDRPAQLLACPGYTQPATDRRLTVHVDVIVDETGTVRHTSFRPTRSGMLRDEASRASGIDSWQEHRADARRLAQACEFAPAVHEGEAVAVSTSVQFDFLGDPALSNVSLSEEGCPPKEDPNAKGTRTRPARCGG